MKQITPISTQDIVIVSVIFAPLSEVYYFGLHLEHLFQPSLKAEHEPQGCKDGKPYRL